MSTNNSGTIVQRFGSRIADVVEEVMPSPFLFAIILSYIVFLGGVFIEGAGPAAMMLLLIPFLAVALIVIPY